MKKYKSILLALPLLGIFSGCSSISYLVDAGIGQWRLMNRARPVEEVLASKTIDEKTKDAIRLILEAKKFAVDELNLKATENYNSFVKLDGAYASYVVTASHPLKLEAKVWRFPIVGEIPYIGFFEEAKAKKFIADLVKDESNWFTVDSRKLPPDTNLRGASAYSTLGWFPDPLYSSMIQASERRMVDTVIHESVHATVFVGSNMDFNERLANFIGLEGSLLFLKKKYGENNDKVLLAKAALASEAIFAKFIDEARSKYKVEVEANMSLGVDAALAKKAKFYAELPKLYDTIHQNWARENPGINPPRWAIDFPTWNNAVLNGHSTYNANFSVFRSLYLRCDSDVKRLIHWISTENDAKDSKLRQNPDEYLVEMSKSGICPKT